MNKINNILESLVSINEDMKSISGKNKVMDYKVVNNKFDIAEDSLGLSNSDISNLNKNKVVKRDYVYSIGDEEFCVINTRLAISNYCFGVLLGYEDIKDVNDIISGLKMDFEETFSSLIIDGCVAYDIKAKKILSFNDGIKKCMDDMLSPILIEIYTIFIKSGIDTKGLTCDVVIDGELCAEAVEIVLNCNIDMNKLKGNKDDIYSCIEYAHEVLAEDKKKYGISRVTNKDVYSISFEIAF